MKKPQYLVLSGFFVYETRAAERYIDFPYAGAYPVLRTSFTGTEHNMHCELCGTDPTLIFLLPLVQENGKLDTMACEECAMKSGAYCQRHNRIHQGFIDHSTACLSCVEEIVENKKTAAARIVKRLSLELPIAEMEILEDAAKASSLLTRSEENICIMRFIASKAVRSKHTFDEVLEVIRTSRRIDHILW